MEDPVKVPGRRAYVFNGRRYYLCGRYWSRELSGGGREYLHRAVWVANRGPIPARHDVHHEDEDRENNTIANLRCKPKAVHASEHGRKRDRSKLVASLALGAGAARAWHASPEGVAWHAAHGRRSWRGRPATECTCEECGKRFKTRGGARARRHCGNNCKMRAYRRARKSVA